MLVEVTPSTESGIRVPRVQLAVIPKPEKETKMILRGVVWGVLVPTEVEWVRPLSAKTPGLCFGHGGGSQKRTG